MEKINNYEWLSCIPEGWETIGRKMIEECEAVNPSYQIEDMKEKWGELRVTSYINGDDDWSTSARSNEEIEQIENKYREMSTKICCICGKPATKISIGYICPFCDNCGTKEEKFYKRLRWRNRYCE